MLNLESVSNVTVMDAVGVYVASLRTKESQSKAQQHLMRFVQWCGPERALAHINPSDVDEFGERAVGTSGGSHAVERLQGIRKFLAFAKKKGLIEQNLAPHLRIRKGKSRSLRNAVALGSRTVELTADGHREMKSDLARLYTDRETNAGEIRRAAADKDVRENAPLEAAREEQGQIESRIAQIENTLNMAVVIDPSRKIGKSVTMGARVLLKELDTGRETRYTLVSALEAKPLEGRISDVSPVGRALFKKSAGQEIAVETPRGVLRYRIIRVSS
jgi:transcription elongation factor GreA